MELLGKTHMERNIKILLISVLISLLSGCDSTNEDSRVKIADIDFQSDVVEACVKKQAEYYKIKFADEFKRFQCEGAQLPTTGLRHFSNLESIALWGIQNPNGFNTQDFSQVRTFNLGFSQLETLDISSMAQLESLELVGNFELRAVDLSYNVKLKEIDIEDCPVEELNLSVLTELEEIRVNVSIFHPVKGYYESPLAELDFSNSKKLNRITLGGINLTKLELIDHQDLEYILIGSPIKEARIDAANLRTISLLETTFTQIDLSLLPELEYLYLASGELTSIRFDHNHKLKKVTLKNNKLDEETLAYLKTLPDSIEVIVEQ